MSKSNEEFMAAIQRMHDKQHCVAASEWRDVLRGDVPDDDRWVIVYTIRGVRTMSRLDHWQTWRSATNEIVHGVSHWCELPAPPVDAGGKE